MSLADKIFEEFSRGNMGMAEQERDMAQMINSVRSFAKYYDRELKRSRNLYDPSVYDALREVIPAAEEFVSSIEQALDYTRDYD
jgi:hypothetical protein